MGGEIWAESRKNVGSIFHMVIPFHLCADRSGPDLHTGNDLKPMWEGEKLHILLADDQESNRNVMCKLLARFGHTVETAANGDEVLEKWGENLFDIVLMDVEMPGMDGTNAMRRIREIEEGSRKRTPVIALTAHALTNQQEFLLGLGYDGYVPKPVELPVLLQDIKRCLHLPSGEPRASTGPADERAAGLVDKVKVADILESIEVLLQQRNMAVMDKVVELTGVLPEGNLLNQLNHQVRQFDCVGALTTVQHLRDELGNVADSQL
jgi:CheY-like chemotaxis protein